MYSHHPPDVVTLSIHPQSVDGEPLGTESPLSSTPNSPRGSPERASPEADRETEELSRPPQSAAVPPSPMANTKSEVPFDERGQQQQTRHPDDEKKVDEGDELMGKQPTRDSYRTLPPVLLNPNGEEEEEEPPSLSISRTWTGGDMPADIPMKSNRKEHKTPSPRRSFSEDANPEEEMAAHRARYLGNTTSYSSHKRPSKEHDLVARTPVQALKSPPKLEMHTMDWELPSLSTVKKYPIDRVNVAVPPSPGTPSSTNDSSTRSDEEEAPGDETQATQTPLGRRSSRPMISPDGKVEYRQPKTTEQAPAGIPITVEERSDSTHMTENLTPKASFEELEPVTMTGSRSQPNQSLAPFHPQGAVQMDPSDEDDDDDNTSQEDDEERETYVSMGRKPSSLATRSVSEPMGRDWQMSSQAGAESTSTDALQQFTSTFSEAVDLATSGAAAIMGDFFPSANHATACAYPRNATATDALEEGPVPDAPSNSSKAAVTTTHEEAGIVVTDNKSLFLERPVSGSMTRSVSEIPRSTTLANPLATKDWNKYLQNRGTNSLFTASMMSSSNATKEGGNGLDVPQGLNSATITEGLPKRTRYRQMTPKKDFQTSEKSAAWLQEEFQRRSIIKKDINDAILAQNAGSTTGSQEDASETEDEMAELDRSIELDKQEKEGEPSVLDNSFTKELAKALGALPVRVGSSPEWEAPVAVDTSHHSEDDEVAAITTTAGSQNGPDRDLSSRQGPVTEASHSDEDGAPEPRRLEYGNPEKENRHKTTVSEPYLPSIAGSVPNNTIFAGRQDRVATRGAEVLASPNVAEIKRANARTRNLNDGLQQEMLRFANDTRAALRESKQSHSSNDGLSKQDESDVLSSPFRSLAISSSLGVGDTAQAIEIDASFHQGTRGPHQLGHPGVPLIASSSRGSEAETAHSDSTGNLEIASTPVLVRSMDSVFGIAKGDIALSLLNENTGRIETSKKATWANRVHGAIWRCRRMRRSMGGFPALPKKLPLNSPARGRSSLPVDMDKARVAGGVRSVQSTQEAALVHLKHDEIDEALELFEDIIFAYYHYFERSLKEREANPGVQTGSTTDFRPFIGVALHNLGILNLLNGEYTEALSFFTRALDNRRACLGEGHPDHVASLVKLATCHFALNEFAEAHAKLEKALVHARNSGNTLADQMQRAEILNNLGCLAYMCGQPGAANTFYRESLDVQFGVLSHSLYLSTAHIGQSISLNISITRANIGFVKLVTKDLPVAVTALENALMEQQILLTGGNDTVIATMDHLAVANLLNGDHQKAVMMFGRILELQQSEYGPHDRRCYVTVDKINMVKSQGTNFEQAVEELRKTFSLPAPSKTLPTSAKMRSDNTESLRASAMTTQSQQILLPKTKNQKNKVMKVLTSIRKKKPAQIPTR